MKIDNNKVVKLNYKGTLANGEVFDSSEGREPLEFIFGAQMIIPGLENGIKGLKVVDKKKVNVKADDAYGPRMDEAVQEVPKMHFPADIKLEKGMQLAAQGPHGVIPVVIADIKKDTVMVDFNHPLAGKDLIFEIEVVHVRDATAEELSHGHTHGEDGHGGHDHHHGHHHNEGHECGCSHDEPSKKGKKDKCCGSGKCKDKGSSLEDELSMEAKPAVKKDVKKTTAKKAAKK